MEKELISLSQKVRVSIIKQAFDAKVGHIGSALSIVELISVLYKKILNYNHSSYIDRDRFVLSKGHAALALYSLFFHIGLLKEDELKTYCKNNSFLGVHPELGLKGIDFATGSLGHGLSFAVGAALSARLEKSSRKVFALISDAECNEGVVWEAALFASHHKLSNLTVIIDRNGQQAFGYTKDVLAIKEIEKTWECLGWYTKKIDGHNVLQIYNALNDMKKLNMQPKPKLIVADTIFGKGVSFMESQIKWHYLPMNDDEFASAIKEVTAK